MDRDQYEKMVAVRTGGLAGSSTARESTVLEGACSMVEHDLLTVSANVAGRAEALLAKLRGAVPQEVGPSGKDAPQSAALLSRLDDGLRASIARLQAAHKAFDQLETLI